MCKSKAEGGRRCASHLYPAYREAMDNYRRTLSLTPENISEITLTAKAYASTPFGYKKIELDIIKLWEVERAKLNIPAEDLVANLELSEKLHSEGIISILSDSLNLGSRVNRQYSEKEAEIKKLAFFNPSLASEELKKALEEQNLSINTFFSAIKVSRALGANIPAIEGSNIFELSYEQGSYDSWHRQSIGFYSTREQAEIAKANFIYTDTEDADNTPWGNIKDYLDPAEWESKRKEYFQENFDKVIEWYSADRATENGSNSAEGRDFKINEHTIDKASEIIWKD